MGEAWATMSVDLTTLSMCMCVRVSMYMSVSLCTCVHVSMYMCVCEYAHVCV
jgi:hypothetical protein